MFFNFDFFFSRWGFFLFLLGVLGLIYLAIGCWKVVLIIGGVGCGVGKKFCF